MRHEDLPCRVSRICLPPCIHADCLLPLGKGGFRAKGQAVCCRPVAQALAGRCTAELCSIGPRPAHCTFLIQYNSLQRVPCRCIQEYLRSGRVDTKTSKTAANVMLRVRTTLCSLPHPSFVHPCTLAGRLDPLAHSPGVSLKHT